MPYNVLGTRTGGEGTDDRLFPLVDATGAIVFDESDGTNVRRVRLGAAMAYKDDDGWEQIGRALPCDLYLTDSRAIFRQPLETDKPDVAGGALTALSGLFNPADAIASGVWSAAGKVFGAARKKPPSVVVGHIRWQWLKALSVRASSDPRKKYATNELRLLISDATSAERRSLMVGCGVPVAADLGALSAAIFARCASYWAARPGAENENWTPRWKELVASAPLELSADKFNTVTMPCFKHVLLTTA